MSQIPVSLYDAKGCRALDRTAIEDYGIAGFSLMQRAGQAAFSVLRECWPEANSIVVVCGSGNNGGDGYIVAGLAAQQELDVTLFALSEPRSDDARSARVMAIAAGVEPQPLPEHALPGSDLLVDAVLGTGIDRAPDREAKRAIELMNLQDSPRLALDISSGLSADSGHTPGVAVEASATSTFIGMKAGLLTGRGPEFSGRVFFHDLDVPEAVYSRVPPLARRIDTSIVKTWLPIRRQCVHKGDLGHALLAGGNRGMSGALRIAAESAARTGAGMVSALTLERNIGGVNVRQPEIMVHGLTVGAGVGGRLANVDAVGLGPGLGRDAWARSVFEQVLRLDAAKVLDADALNLLADSGRTDGNWILTPHPGEAARLLGCSAGEINTDRIGAVRAISERYGGICVLKGCGTLICGDQQVYLCDRGNPGMASGGMGDCLTGVITSLRAQGLTPMHAAVCGVWLHASAADIEAGANGVSGMLASDLYRWIRKLQETPDCEN